MKVPRPILAAELTPRPQAVSLEPAQAAPREVDITIYAGAALVRYSWSRGEYELTLSTDPAHIRMDRLRLRGPILHHRRLHRGPRQ